MMCVLCEDETWVITEGCDTTALCEECREKHEKKERPCEHGWIKTEDEPFCHYCEGCCF